MVICFRITPKAKIDLVDKRFFGRITVFPYFCFVFPYAFENCEF